MHCSGKGLYAIKTIRPRRYSNTEGMEFNLELVENGNILDKNISVTKGT